MANIEYLPVAPASIGTITRNPLPNMEERGVAVARNSSALFTAFSYPASGINTINRLLYRLNLTQQLLIGEVYGLE